MKLHILLLCCLAFACSARAQGNLATALQKALFEEEANHNLAAAIEQYQSIIKTADEQRRLAATALFRLGECYRKLGRTNEAAEVYARVVRDFSDQKHLADQAAARIGQPKPTQLPAAGVGTNAELSAWIRQLVEERNQELRQRTLRKLISDKKDFELQSLLPLLFPSSVPSNPFEMLKARLELEREFEALQVTLSDDHPEVRKTKEALQKVRDQLYSWALSALQMQDLRIAGHRERAEELDDRLRNRELTPYLISARNGALRDKLFSAAQEEAALRQMIVRGSTSVATDRDDLHEALATARAHLAGFLKGKDDTDNPETKKLKARLAALDRQMAARAQILLASAEMLLAANSEVQKLLSAELEKTGRGFSAAAAADAAENRWAEFDRLFANSPDLLNSADATNGMSFLQKAALSSDLDFLDYLIKRGVDPNRRGISSGNRETPLNLAVQNGHKAAAERLIAAGADVNNRGGAMPPLASAASRGFTEIAELLISKGAKVNDPEFPPIHYAASAGHVPMLNLLLRHGADVNLKLARPESGLARTALTGALERCRPEAVKLLLDHGANADISWSKNTRTAEEELTGVFAAMELCPEALPLLLAKGANPNRGRDSEGRPPLIAALRAKNVAAMELLLKHGADPDLRDTRGGSALEYASGRQFVGPISRVGDNSVSSPELVALLLNHKADPNAIGASFPEANGGSPLSYAIANPGIVRVLLEHGANPNLAAVRSDPLSGSRRVPRASDSESPAARTLLDNAIAWNAPAETLQLLRQFGATNSVTTPPGAARPDPNAISRPPEPSLNPP